MRIEGAFGCIVKDNKYLLVKNSYNPNWFFPGGEIEEGETPREALKRVFGEELGMHIEVLELISKIEKSKFSHKYQREVDYKIYHFLCDTDDKPVEKEKKIDKIGYFSLEDLKEMKVPDDVVETAKEVSKIN